MRAAIALVAILTASTAALALDSETTPLDVDKCEVAEMATADEAGEPLAKEDQYPVAWRCRGLGDRFVYVVYGDERESLAFGSGKNDTTRYMRHGHFGSWGPSVEWRGAKHDKGWLEPVAAIVKYGWNIPQGKQDGSDDVGGDLGVIRLGKGSDDTCLFAWVDVVANADAIDIARKAADEQASSHDCPKLEGEDADAADGAQRIGKGRQD